MTGEHALGAIVDVFLLLSVLLLLGGIALGAGVIAPAVAAFFSSGAKRIALIAVASLGVVAILWNSEVFGISSGRKKQQTKGYTSLMKAVHKKDVKKVKKLLKKGADPNETRAGLSPLIIACNQFPDDFYGINESSDEIVLLLLEANADPNLRTNTDGEKELLPLERAIEHSRIEAVRALVLHGASIDSLDEKDGMLDFMPVQFALTRGFNQGTMLKITEILLDNGAKTGHYLYKYEKNTGETIIMRMIHYIPEKSDEKELALKLFERFLEDGVNVNEKDGEGRTALHYGAEYSFRHKEEFPFAEKLLSYKADINAKDNKGRTPLMLLIINGYSVERLFPAVEFFVSHGADVSLTNNWGELALDLFKEHFNWAKDQEHYDEIERLLTPDSKSTTPKSEKSKISEIRTDGQTLVAKATAEEKNDKIADLRTVKTGVSKKEAEMPKIEAEEHIALCDISDDW